MREITMQQTKKPSLPLYRRLLYLIRTCFLILLLIASTGIRPALAADVVPAAPMTAQAMADFFDVTLAKQLADEHIVGATVSVVKDGELLFAKGYGYADLVQKIPVTADQTLFFPGSTGKLFTWTALMQLVEQGKLDLHTDINQYLDFTLPATFAEAITLEHLLTHTAGFEEQFAALLAADQAALLPLGEFLKTTVPARVYAPGTTFAYSNYATVLAGYIIERVSGEPYAQYITDHVLTPLAMTQSTATQPLPPALMADLSKGYHYRNGQYSSVDFEWVAGAPAAPIHTTATDMAKFMIMHLNHCQVGDAHILQEASCAVMHQRQFAYDPRVNGMGYGFMVSEQNGKSIAWHTGGSAYFNTMLALIPDENVGFFISYNTPVAELYQSLINFVDHFYPAPVTATVAPPIDSAQRIAALRGNYVSTRVAHQSPQKLVTWQSEALTVKPGANNTLQVGSRTYTEIEPGLFHQVDGPRALIYRTDPQGQVTQIFWGSFAYFKIPWYQTVSFQLLLAGSALLIMLTAALAWPVEWLVRRRRGGKRPGRWAAAARWTAVGLALLNSGLLVWFLALLLGFGDTFVFPMATIMTITRLWWINLPGIVALLIFTILAWKDHYWGTARRIHYTLVTLAAVTFLWFLLNWNLLMV